MWVYLFSQFGSIRGIEFSNLIVAMFVVAIFRHQDDCYTLVTIWDQWYTQLQHSGSLRTVIIVCGNRLFTHKGDPTLGVDKNSWDVNTANWPLVVQWVINLLKLAVVLLFSLLWLFCGIFDNICVFVLSGTKGSQENWSHWNGKIGKIWKFAG